MLGPVHPPRALLLGGLPRAQGFGSRGLQDECVEGRPGSWGSSQSEARPAGRARVLGADETVFSVKGEEVVVGFVVDASSGKTLGFEVLFEGDGEAFRRWLEPYVKRLGVEILISDDNDSYGMAAAELGLSHQLCIAHVRKYVTRRADSSLEQAEKEWEGEEEEKLKKLKEDLKVLTRIIHECLRRLPKEHAITFVPDGPRPGAAVPSLLVP